MNNYRVWYPRKWICQITISDLSDTMALVISAIFHTRMINELRFSTHTSPDSKCSKTCVCARKERQYLFLSAVSWTPLLWRAGARQLIKKCTAPLHCALFAINYLSALATINYNISILTLARLIPAAFWGARHTAFPMEISHWKLQ